MKVRLGDVSEKKIDILNAAYTGNIEYIDISSIDNQKKKITQTHRIPVENAPSRAKQLVNVGDILVSTVRPNLNAVALIGQRAGTENVLVASTGYCVLRCLPQAYSNYVFYFCQSPTFIENISSQASGASYPAVTSAIVKNCLIPLPSLEEQRHIAAVLDKVRELISKRRAQLDKLDELVKSRFVEMFGDCKENPKGWETKRLEEIADVGSSKRVFEKEYVSEGIPFYRTKEIVELSKGNRITTELFITRKRYDEIQKEYGVPKAGDLLISAVGTIGVIWIVDGKNDFYFKDGNLLRVATNENFEPIYLKHLLETLIGAYKHEMSSGTAYAALTISALKHMLIYEVPIEEQKKFAAFVEQT